MLENISNYSNPSLLYVVGIMIISIFCITLWRMTDRNYNEKAEDYWNREYLDYSDRLDNIIITKEIMSCEDLK